MVIFDSRYLAPSAPVIEPVWFFLFAAAGNDHLWIGGNDRLDINVRHQWNSIGENITATTKLNHITDNMLAI